MAKGTSPTQRTLKELKKQGYRAQVVEKWNPWARVRVDLFEVIDVLAMKDDLLAVQTTTMGEMPKRYEKIRASSLARQWLRLGLRLEIWGWAKRGPKNKKKWTLKVEVVRLPEVDS